MSYFFNFPKIQYDIEGDGVTDRVVDILSRVGISEKIRNNVAAFRLKTNPSSARPEVVADKQYRESGLFWIPLMMNESIDPMYDWVLDDTTFEAFLDVKYPGSTFFVDYMDVREMSSSSSSSRSSSSTEARTSSSTEASETSSLSASISSDSSSSSSSSLTSGGESSTSISSSSSLSSSSTVGEATSGSSLSSSSTDNSNSSRSSSSSTEPSASSSSSSTAVATSNNSSSSSQSSSSSSVEINNFVKGETVTFSDGRTGVVHAWDSTFRRLVVTGITDQETVEDLVDTVVSGGTSSANAVIRRAIPYSRFAVHHFEADIVDNDGATLFKNVVLSPLDYIDGYINGGVDTNAVTNFAYEYTINENKRNIFVPDEGFALGFKSDLTRLMSEQ